ncbi:transposase [Undibacterium sp. Ren11W]|uniref:transposase n=1 Tax=Undibacterium sp. Ren11W TaxID=3413045 RepID=UPI003BF2E572
MSYTHLTELEREFIARQLQEKQSKREIARQLGRNVTSICREVKRSCDEHGQYRPIHAHQRAHQKRHIARRQRKLASRYAEGLWAKVRFKLERAWSPNQISLWLQRAFPDTPDYHVSHTTIYHHIYLLPKGELKRQIVSNLRQEGKKRKSARKAMVNHGLKTWCTRALRRWNYVRVWGISRAIYYWAAFIRPVPLASSTSGPVAA